MLLADFIALSAAYYTALYFRFSSGVGDAVFRLLGRLMAGGVPEPAMHLYLNFYIISAPRIILQSFVLLVILYALHDLYASRRFLHYRPAGWRIMLSNMLAMLMFLTYFYFMRNIFHPRSFFFIMLILNSLYCPLARRFADKAMDHFRRRFSVDLCPVVVYGDGPAAADILEYIRENRPHGLVPAGHYIPLREEPFNLRLAGLMDMMESRGALMIICADRDLSLAQIMELLERAGERDLYVKIWSDKIDVLMHNAGLPFDVFEDAPLVHFGRISSAEHYQRFKRPIDLLVALCLLVLSAPVWLLAAFAIMIGDRGQVLFVQERIGVDRKPFKIYKFRTMRKGADRQQQELEELNETGAGLFKIKRDPRITRVGRLLRRFSLDEVPQLLNVIKGEMALVGPRPLPLRDFSSYYEQWHYIRHAGRPGLTCLWQISGRSKLDFRSMCILDVYYLYNQNWVLDLKILLNTVKVVVFAEGAW